jgi:hypothetical protein
MPKVKGSASSVPFSRADAHNHFAPVTLVSASGHPRLRWRLTPEVRVNPSISPARPHGANALDRAARSLTRSVLSPDWDPRIAAEALLDGVGDDPALLRVLRAKLARAMLGRSTLVLERAVATLDQAQEMCLAAASAEVAG